MESFTSTIVSCLKEIDLEQTEGGIYALPDRCSKGSWPAPYHCIFGGERPDLDLCSKIGTEAQGVWDKRLKFEIDGESASLQFVNIALTKVRSYGNRFQLDKHHGKKWEDYSQELKRAVSKLNKDVKRGYFENAFLAAFVFTENEKHCDAIIAPSIEEDFLIRYGLTSSHETWSDPHGRGIWTSVLCWRAQDRAV